MDENSGKKIRVLIADDQTILAEGIKSVLETDAGLETAGIACDGADALEKCRVWRPDVVLMDIRMPVMDGIQATEKIRTISLSVPIIAVTAYAFYTEQQQAIQAGCNAVISKPYSLEKLKETIESYIG